MRIRVPSQSDLSEPSSENLARKVRHDQHRARQKKREAETKYGTETRRTRKESPLKRWPSNKFGVNGPTIFDDPLTPEELAEDYKSSLEDLAINSRWEIGNLTVIAKENIHAAQAISKVVEEHIQKVSHCCLESIN